MSKEISKPDHVDQIVWDEHRQFVAQFAARRQQEAAAPVIRETVIIRPVDDYTKEERSDYPRVDYIEARHNLPAWQ